MDQLIVIETILPGCRANADNPQAAEIAFALLPIAIGIDQSLIDRLLGKFVKLALIEVVTLRKLQDLFTAIVAFCSTFNSRHGELLIY